VVVSRVLGLLGGAPPLWTHESEYVDYYLLENSPHLRVAIEEAERAYADGRVMSLEEFERELIGGRN